MRVKVLGSAAGGGFPQWNCACRNCRSLRSGQLRSRARTQAQVAVASSGSGWLLLNASPDLRTQILSTPDLAPARFPRSTGISAILLTNAEVDSVVGLLHLREFQPFRIFATPSVKRILFEENRIFRVLERARPPVIWHEIPSDAWFSTDAAADGQVGLRCRAVSLGGGYPDYVSDGLRRELPPDEAAIGLVFTDGNKQMMYAPSLSGQTDGWKTWARSSDLCLLDGTFWDDRELIDAAGGSKTAREIGHIPLSGPGGLLEEFRDGGRARRVLIHMNNTNPVLDEDSAEYRKVRHEGWEIAYDGTDFDV
jgi:pyrroloquinoline quinone biosynthesis protein B